VTGLVDLDGGLVVEGKRSRLRSRSKADLSIGDETVTCPVRLAGRSES
jgi:hypothetical protein